MKDYILIYPSNQKQVTLLQSIKDKYKFGRKKFYKSYSFDTNTITIYKETLRLESKLSYLLYSENWIVSSWIIRERNNTSVCSGM